MKSGEYDKKKEERFDLSIIRNENYFLVRLNCRSFIGSRWQAWLYVGRLGGFSVKVSLSQDSHLEPTVWPRVQATLFEPSVLLPTSTYLHTCVYMFVAEEKQPSNVECGRDYGLLTYLRVWSQHPLI